MSPIGSVSCNYLQSLLGTALQKAGLPPAEAASTIDGSPVSSDSGRLSPFAQWMSTLQQLQQSDPARYRQVASQIATNLQSAAQTAQSQGNTTAANQLNQIATDFTNASQNGQLPDIQDLASAIAGHRHHHHAHANSGDSSSSSSNDSSGLSQLLSTLTANPTQNDALNPLGIIGNTLSNAGIATT